jgi:hypothetical protein
MASTRASSCRGAVLLALAVGATVTGCSNVDEPAVRNVASSFARGEPQGRCDLLAPTTLAGLVRDEASSCPEAIGQLPLGSGEVVSVEVWGVDALVHLTDDTLFLTRGEAGWQVSAAACTPGPQAEGPYACQLEGS